MLFVPAAFRRCWLVTDRDLFSLSTHPPLLSFEAVSSQIEKMLYVPEEDLV